MGNDDRFQQYTFQFIQRVPKYGVKNYGPGQAWRTVTCPLTDRQIQRHLAGEIAVGSVGRWYPSYAILDIDDRSLQETEDIRADLGLDESNSMLCSSESRNSYHLLIRPTMNDKPPTLSRLNGQFKSFCKVRGIEIYPQRARIIRLPFGRLQECLDAEYVTSTFEYSWQTELAYFLKRDFFDLADVPSGQSDLSFKSQPDPMLAHLLRPNAAGKSYYQMGKDFFEHGLQEPSSRHRATFCVIYYLWRHNIPLDNAIHIAWTWISTHHNGFSKDIQKIPQVVKAELVRLRYFVGMTIPQAAEVMGISASSVDRHWAYARAWLHQELIKRDTSL